MPSKKRKYLRSRNPKVLGDLVGGDCFVINWPELGPQEVQVGFRIGSTIFVRVKNSAADQLISFSEDTPFLELTYEQPMAQRANEIVEEVDPLFGMGATDGGRLFKGRNEP